jgi:hypothetical protein
MGTPEWHRAESRRLRRCQPHSQAANLHELAARAGELEAKIRWIAILIQPSVPSPSIVPDETLLR